MAKLLYFGKLSDITGCLQEIRALPDEVTTTEALRAHLDDVFSASGALLEKTVRIALNNQIAAEPAPVRDTDEIAFMPPVGGG